MAWLILRTDMSVLASGSDVYGLFPGIHTKSSKREIEGKGGDRE